MAEINLLPEDLRRKEEKLRKRRARKSQKIEIGLSQPARQRSPEKISAKSKPSFWDKLFKKFPSKKPKIEPVVPKPVKTPSQNILKSARRQKISYRQPPKEQRPKKSGWQSVVGRPRSPIKNLEEKSRPPSRRPSPEFKPVKPETSFRPPRKSFWKSFWNKLSSRWRMGGASRPAKPKLVPLKAAPPSVQPSADKPDRREKIIERRRAEIRKQREQEEAAQRKQAEQEQKRRKKQAAKERKRQEKEETERRKQAEKERKRQEKQAAKERKRQEKEEAERRKQAEKERKRQLKKKEKENQKQKQMDQKQEDNKKNKSKYHLAPQRQKGNFEVNLMPEELGSVKHPGRRTKVFALVLAVVLPAVVIAGCYWLIVLACQSEQEKIAVQNQKIRELKQELRPREDYWRENRYLRKKVEKIDQLWKEHVYWTDFFELLEKYTLDGVHYKSFSADLSGEFVLPTEAINYGILARQIVAFEQSNNFVKEVSVDNISLVSEPGGGVAGVSCDLNLKIAPEVFKKLD